MKLEFRFRIVPTLATVLLLPILIGLGFWQLDRSNQKIQIHDRYVQRINSPPEMIGSTIELPEELEFRRLRASGQWNAQHEFLLDNRVRNGQPGFHVITPLVFRGGQSAVLVNRGWIPGVPDRSRLPVIPPLEGETTVTGTAVIPPKDVFVLKQPLPIEVNSWPRIWQTLDIERFAKAAPFKVQNIVILMDDEHEAGFQRQWPPPDSSWIARHKAYAFQWFALSATLLVIYFLLAFRPRRK